MLGNLFILTNIATSMDTDSLENALNSAKEDAGSKEKVADSEMSKEEEVGFHKGALNTLVAEKNELVKIIGNIENIMQAHIGRLKELGVDIK